MRLAGAYRPFFGGFRRAQGHRRAFWRRTVPRMAGRWTARQFTLCGRRPRQTHHMLVARWLAGRWPKAAGEECPAPRSRSPPWLSVPGLRRVWPRPSLWSLRGCSQGVSALACSLLGAMPARREGFTPGGSAILVGPGVCSSVGLLDFRTRAVWARPCLGRQALFPSQPPRRASAP